MGIAYGVIGVVFAALDDGDHVRLWRLGAWVVSAVVFAAHLGYEHYGLRSPARTTALRVAGTAGLGAFALALAANIHALSAAASAQQSRLLLALVIWPVMVFLPAFLVALAGAAVLGRVSRQA